MDRNEYARAYAEGYAAGIATVTEKRLSPVLRIEDIQERYGVGVNKARQILQAIRRNCNGGKLDAAGAVLVSEAEYWETLVDKQFRARL
jgi:hypothetical protein